MELKISVWAVPNHYDTEHHYVLSDSDMSTEGWVCIKEHVVEFEPVSTESLIGPFVENLRKKKAEIFENAAQSAAKVEESIQKYLAIEAPKGGEDDIPF